MSREGTPAVFVAEPVAAPGCGIGESPVWDASRGSVTFVDIAARRLFQLASGDGSLHSWDLPVTVSALALSRAGGFVAATDRGFALLSLASGEPVFDFAFADGPALPQGWRMNDGACDRQGRFWAGSLSPTPGEGDQWGALHSLGRGGAAVPRGGRFRVQNGLAFSPDGRRMYVSDSHISQPHVMRYDFDPDTGERSGGVAFAPYERLGGRPDGAAMDVDGCYWIAASDSGRVLRLTPEGVIDAEIRVATPNPTNLCFCGPDLKTAFLTTLRRDGIGGGVFMVDLPFQGLAEPFYEP